MSLRSPMGRVLGLGTAKKGAAHWWSQRVTSVALLFLALWFVICVTGLGGFDYATVIGWMREPSTAVLLTLLIATTAYHSQLGVQVIVEDYVAGKGLKIVTLLVLDFIHVALAALGIFAVLRIAFGAAA